MPLSIDGLTIARATVLIYIVIMVCHIYMAIGFGRELKTGKNGITLGLMFLFITLANEHFYLAVASWLILYPDIYAIYQFSIWLWRFLTLSLIVASFMTLFYEFRRGANRAKSR